MEKSEALFMVGREVKRGHCHGKQHGVSPGPAMTVIVAPSVGPVPGSWGGGLSRCPHTHTHGSTIHKSGGLEAATMDEG